jgi:basic membrane lipoprotein Med (substrate-binding protein (PBP1-ABC) superfamily)
MPPPRAVVYTDFQACLLTGPQGLADSTAATVWSGMQDASTATHAKVSYLAVAGPDTAGTVSPYVATLVQRKCNIVLTTDAIAADAITQAATQHADVRFVTVSGSAGSGHVTTISPDSATVSRLIQEAVAHS